MKPYGVLIAIGAFASGAFAQQPASAPNPADPSAKAPPVHYDSAFAGYAPYREEKLVPWREVNDEVGKVRGHVGIFGGAGHAGHGIPGQPAPSKPEAGKPSSSKQVAPKGQAPVREAPKAPAGEHKGH